MVLTLALTSILLVIGMVGTVIGIISLVYPSGGRRQRLVRADKDSRENAETQPKKTTVRPNSGA
jgi:hypothetical protein